MPFHDPTEYLDHGAVIKRGDADGVEMTQEARCDRITPTPRWAHGTNHLNVNQVNWRGVLQIIPEKSTKRLTP